MVGYSEDLEDDLNDLESCAIHLEICHEQGQIDPAEERYQIHLIDHMVNTYGIDCKALIQHARTMKRIYRTRSEKKASKHLETVHEAFLAQICDNYEGTF